MHRTLLAITFVVTAACSAADTTGPMFEPSGDYQWQLLTAAADWPPQRGLRHTISFDGRIWLMDDEVGFWWTEDGESWTAFSGSLEANAFGTKLLVFRDELVGVRRDGPQDEVWASPNGIDWRKLGDGPALSSRNHRAVVFADRLWLFGNSRLEAPYAWSSEDGENWSQAPDPPWEPRGDYELVVHDGRLWAIGGRSSVNGNPDDLIATNDTWVTEDGQSWQHRTWNLSWPNRIYYGVEVYDGRLWLLGGGEGGTDGERNDVWTSTDGANWELLEANAPWGARFAMSTVVHNDRLFLFAGKQGPEDFYNDVWSLERLR